MAAIEYRILTKVLEAKTLQEALQAGLSEDQFKDPESRQIWRYLRRHWFNRATVKTLPSLRAVQDRWPAFKMVMLSENDDAPVKALVHNLKLKTFESDVRSLAGYFQELVEEDPKEAVRAMQGCLTDLNRQFRQSPHLGIDEIIDEAKDHYDAALDGVNYGLSWPWKCLTEDTMGKRPGDLIVFYARMKQMKTWLVLYCAVHDYLVNNARVLIWSREMNKEKMCLRLASLLAKVDYQLFKKGKLPPAIQKRAWATFKALKAEGEAGYDARDEDGNLLQRQFILLCGRDAPKELEIVQGFIQEYHPDIAYFDSFYHMETANMKGVTQRWHRLAILSEDVKSLAEDECIPIIAVHQANRSGEKTHGNTMTDMADTDVLAREADLVARIIKRAGRELNEEDYEGATEQAKLEAAARREERSRPGRPRIRVPQKVEEEALRQEEEKDEVPRMGAELAIVLPGNREGVLNAFTVKAIPGYNFDFIDSNYSLAQIEEWIKEDEATDATDMTKKSGGEKKSQPQKPKFNTDSFKLWKQDRSKGPKGPKGKPS